MVVFNVEIFHALYIIYSMQSATSMITILALILLDVVSLCVAIRRLNALGGSRRRKCTDQVAFRQNGSSRSINSVRSSDLAGESHQDTAHDSRSPSAVSAKVTEGSTGPPSPLEHNKNLLELVLYILEDSTIRVRSHTRLAHMPRISIAPAPHPQQAMTAATPDGSLGTIFSKPIVIKQQATANRTLTRLDTQVFQAAAILTDEEKRGVQALSRIERRARVENLLKLLHMAEFMLLVEYTEVMIPIVYCLYLLIISHLPNRMYYAQLKDMDLGTLQRDICNVLLYVSLALVSFLVLSVVLSRKPGTVSGIHQLAFVLETQWQVVQSKLVLWVVFATQSPLEHFGVDYTFQFQWLYASAQQ